MAAIFYDDDAEPAAVSGRRVAVIGYGSQGHAHALNLRESGVEVRVGLRESSRSRVEAQDEGLAVGTVAEVSDWANVVMMLVPDQHMADLYAAEVAPHLRDGDALLLWGSITWLVGVAFFLAGIKGRG